MKIVKADPSAPAMTEPQLREMLQHPYLMRLAFNDHEGWPIVAPLWFLFENERLWFTISKDSRKERRLAADDRCYFTIDVAAEDGILGARGPARARLHQDSALGERLVRQSLHKYLGSEDGPLAETLLAEALAGRVTSVELEVLKYATWSY